MFARVDVEQHPRQRASHPAFAMRPALGGRLQPTRLQHLLDPAITLVNLVLTLQDLMKMPDV